MATFTLKLDSYTLQKLTNAARKAGVAPERMATMTLEAWILADSEPERRPAGVGEPARAWTGVTKDGGPGQPKTTEDDEGPFVDLDVVLDALSAARITARAKMMGITLEELAALELDSRFFDFDDFKWPEGGDPREDNAASYDLNEIGRPWSEVRPEMVAYLQKKLAERRSAMTPCHQVSCGSALRGLRTAFAMTTSFRATAASARRLGFPAATRRS